MTCNIVYDDFKGKKNYITAGAETRKAMTKL